MIKSTSTVQFYGNGNNGNWGVRRRMADGSEVFIGCGQRLTLAQASAAMNTSQPEGAYKPLPAGVRAKA